MAYVLILDEERHAFLETGPAFTEPVPARQRSSRDETVLILRGKEFTHIARGTVGKGRVTLANVRRLTRPLQFIEMPLIIPARLRTHAQRIFTTGGRLPPKTGQAILAALVHLMPDLRQYR